jgi:hypothetical protein
MKELYSKRRGKSGSLDMVKRHGRRRAEAVGSAIRDEMKAAENKFWSGCQLNPDGTRSRKPRRRDICPDLALYGKARITGEQERWLREMDRGHDAPMRDF